MNREYLFHHFPAHRSRLVASLARLVGPTDAEDIANETLLRALSALDGFRGEAALGTWLNRIGINLACDFLRRKKRDPVALAVAENELPQAVVDDNQAEVLEQRQMSQCIQGVLTTLSDSERDLLVQADLHDRTAPEIARVIGITSGNTKIRLHRARRGAKALLEDLCDFHYRENGILCCTPKVKASVSIATIVSSKDESDPETITEPPHAR